MPMLTKPPIGELIMYTPPRIRNVIPTSDWEAPAFRFKCGSSIDSIMPLPQKQKKLSRYGSNIDGD